MFYTLETKLLKINYIFFFYKKIKERYILEGFIVNHI